jgi:phosphohistidine phosphatase
MTRRLILIRHAKSGWGDPYADDHARDLTDRGHTAAMAIGQWLATQGYVPDLILTSDATRALQTTDQVKRGLGTQPETQEHGLLYHAAPETIQDIAVKTNANTLAIVGHNPGIGMAARRFVTYAPKHHRFDDYPTCATTIIDFDNNDWMKAGKGVATDFIVPRDLS